MHALRKSPDEILARPDNGPSRRLAAAGPDSEMIVSPVHELQDLLQAAYLPEPHVKKWAPAWRLGVLGLGASLSWVIVGLGAKLVFA